MVAHGEHEPPEVVGDHVRQGHLSHDAARRKIRGATRDRSQGRGHLPGPGLPGHDGLIRGRGFAVGGFGKGSHRLEDAHRQIRTECHIENLRTFELEVG